MQPRFESPSQALLQLGIRSPRRRLAVVALLGLLLCLLLPIVPIVVGVCLVLVVAVHVWLPELRPYVQPVLRLPVAAPRRRHAHLAAVAGVGALLLTVGSLSATMRGTWHSTWREREKQRAANDDRATTLFERAQACLSKGDVPGAELALLDALEVQGLSRQRKEGIDELLERIHRSGDSREILAVVTELSEKDRQSLRDGTSVPKALDFGDKALTYRAVELALDLLDEAKPALAHP